MEQYFVLVLAVLTSVAAYLAGRVVLGRSAATVRYAVGRMLECVGMTIVFFAINVAAGVVIGLVGRLVTHQFISLYLGNDVSLLVLSLLQGLVFLFWRDASRAERRLREASVRG